MVPSQPAAPRPRLAWLNAALTALGPLLLLFFTRSAPDYRRMFEDFGSAEPLPLLTRMLLTPGVLPGVAALAGAAALAAHLAPLSRTGRRLLLTVAVVLPSVCLLLFLVGTYLPIFSIGQALH